MFRDSDRPPSDHLGDLRPVACLIEEMIIQWQAGVRRPVEEYLARLPGITGDDAVELVLVEVLLRRAIGEPAKTDDYVARFPHLAELLRAQLDRAEPRLVGSTLFIPSLQRSVEIPTSVWSQSVGESGEASSGRPPFDDGQVPRGLESVIPAGTDRTSTVFTQLGDSKSNSTLDVSSSDDAPTRPRSTDDPSYLIMSPLDKSKSGNEVERYKLTKLHAQGGIGQVWLARDVHMGRQVALKELRPDRRNASPLFRERFVEEAKITGQLEHPGIVPVYELARRGSDDLPFYTMRFVQGRTLHAATHDYHSRLKAGTAGRLELDGLLHSFVGVCNTIAYAHSRGVIHRDLKGDNVVLGDFGEVIVLDWGLAKVVDGEEPPVAPADSWERVSVDRDETFEETRHGEVLGTPAYMPPEQAEGRRDLVGPHSDVYGLGAILYEIITGRPPFGGRDAREIISRVIHDDPIRPQQLNPSTSPVLQAICLKAMAKQPSGRYATASELAQEVRRFLSDEPVAAYREPLLKRVLRWSKRHRVLVNSTAAASLIGLASLAYFLYESRIRFEQRVTAAFGRVDALTSAEIRSVPQIIEQLAPDRQLVRERLARLARGEGAGQVARVRVAASLAQLGEDPSQESFLAANAVEPGTPPDEVLVIARELAKERSGSALAGRLLRELTGPDQPMTDRDLRSAGLLAWVAPGNEAWSSIGPRTARKLSTENVLQIGGWRDVFLPVARTLVVPLRAVEGDRTKPEARDRAYMLLLDFAQRQGNTERADDLAALTVEADPSRLDRIINLLGTADDRERAVRWLTAQLADPTTFDEVSAGRQARIALALARLGRFDVIRSKLVFRVDPSVRTELIHEMPRYGVEPLAIAARLRDEPDASVRRALTLSLGEFPPESFKGAERDSLITLLEGWYRDDPDAGVHGAVEWLLRNRWGRGAAIEAIDRSLASREVPPSRGWFLDGQSRAFAIIRGPVTFTMGSTSKNEPERIKAEEVSHLRRIPRSFAIASREVTVGEYGWFLESKPSGVVDRRVDPQYARVFPSPNCATALVTWFDAARYCNWLSEREGIPRQQWCYPQNIGPDMTLDPEHLLRTGYRLPTEAEWEFACRAGTSSSRYHGSSPSRLSSYAWYGGDNRPGLIGLGGSMSPVGQRKPNDFGLFDMLGNAMEWCDSEYLPYPKAGTVQPVDDFSMKVDILKGKHRALRGGTFFFSADLVRSASRIAEGPLANAFVIGFRVARTIQ